MKSKSIRPRSFRPTPLAQKQFEYAEKCRINVSELINEVITRHFGAHLKRRAKTELKRINRIAKRYKLLPLPKGMEELTRSR
jgi:hypothetical protein